jgi:hypothetical protein
MLSRGISTAALILSFLAGAAYTQPPDQTTESAIELKPVAVVNHAPLDEMSGIIKSRTYNDVYWVHNDSGDEPRLFAIHADGTVVMPPWLNRWDYVGEPQEGKDEFPGLKIDLASNIDWEDIAIDGDVIYIADCGNNGNARRDLGVYVLIEPNPEGTSQTRVLKWLPVAYPDQDAYPGAVWHFDCEAVFVFGHKLYFLTKHRAGQIDIVETGTKLYRLDTNKTDEVNVLTKVDERADLGGWVTAADMSPDGKALAVLCHYPVQSVWLFDTPAEGDRFLSSTARRLVFTRGQQCEGICFVDSETLLMTNEQRELFRLKVEDFEPGDRLTNPTLQCILEYDQHVIAVSHGRFGGNTCAMPCYCSF